MATTLVISGAVMLPVAAVYGYVGYRLSRREVSPSNHEALSMFSMWWYALAGSTLVTAGQRTLAGLGVDAVTFHAAVAYLNFLLICAALLGLAYYLVFLFTGWRGALPVLAVFYLGYFLALAYAISVSNPSGVTVGAWKVNLEFATPVEGPLAAALLALLTIPQIVGTLAYLTLVFRVQDRTHRYRILLVSTAILCWFGTSFAATVLGIGGELWWNVTSRAIGVAAAGMILAAYLPPRWIRERLGVRRLAAVGEADLRPEGADGPGRSGTPG